MVTIRPRRSVLYMPGSKERALEKGKTLPTDAIIFDLEDAVAPDARTIRNIREHRDQDFAGKPSTRRQDR